MTLRHRFRPRIVARVGEHEGATEGYAAELVDLAALPDAAELAAPRIPTDPEELDIDIAFQRLIASWHEEPEWLAGFIAESMTYPTYRALRLESTGEFLAVKA